jgi:hypothetical protein
MKRAILKLLIVCGLALSLYEASQYLAARRYLRRDFLLLTVIEDRVKQKTDAGYGFLAGAGILAIGVLGLSWQKSRGA